MLRDVKTIISDGLLGFATATGDGLSVKIGVWGDVDVKFPGLALVVQEVSYDDEMEMEESYGYGHRPRGYGTGNYKSSGKISLLRDDYEESQSIGS